MMTLNLDLSGGDIEREREKERARVVIVCEV